MTAKLSIHATINDTWEFVVFCQQETNKHMKNNSWEISQWEQVRYRHTEQINHTAMMSQM